MRVDDDRVHYLAGGIYDRALHTVTIAGVHPQGGALSGGCGEQKIAQVLREDIHGGGVRPLLQLDPGVHGRADGELRAPAEANALGAELIGRIPLRTEVQPVGNDPLVELVLLPSREVHAEHALALAAQDGQDSVAGKLVQGLREVEVVPVLRPFCFLPIDDADLGDASVEELLADLAHQVGVRGDALNDDGACPGQCCLGVLEPFAEVLLGDACRVLADPRG